MIAWIHGKSIMICINIAQNITIRIKGQLLKKRTA